MKIYTSYWAQVRNFPKNLVGLNTTVWPPKWRPLGQDKRGVIVIDCPPLKPGKECEGLCRGACEPAHPDDCTFLKVYYDQLCTKCSERQKLQKWLRENGVKVEEWHKEENK